MFGSIGATTRIVLLTTIVSCIFGCNIEVIGRETDPDETLEEWFERNDRRVYQELTTEDIIDIVDGVMYDYDDAWPGEWKNDCYERLGWFDVYFFDDITEFCPDDVPDCIGAISVWNWTIHVLTRGQSLLQQYETLGHEYVHYVGRCLYSDEDGEHLRFDYWVRLDPEGSIEARINKIIWQLTRKPSE